MLVEMRIHGLGIRKGPTSTPRAEHHGHGVDHHDQEILVLELGLSTFALAFAVVGQSGGWCHVYQSNYFLIRITIICMLNLFLV